MPEIAPAPADDRQARLVMALAGSPHDATPFFVISGAGGHVLPFQSVARRIADRRSGYGILFPGHFDDEPEPTSVASCARRMDAAMRSVRPNGPYLLVGYSFGGLVALEMARILVGVGEPVGLVLVDTVSSVSMTPRPLHLQIWSKVSFEIRRAAMNRLNGSPRAVDIPSASVDEDQQPGSQPSAVHERFERLSAWCLRVRTEYRPEPCAVPTVLLRATDRRVNHRLECKPDLGWRSLVGNLDVVGVPGSHLDLFKGDKEEPFARHLNDALDRLDAQQKTPATIATLCAPEASHRRAPSDQAKHDPSLRVGRAFSIVAAHRGDDLAVRTMDGDSVSYGELDRWSNSIAQAVTDLGERPGRAVISFLHGGVSQIAAFLGVLKSGQVLTVLDPTTPLRASVAISNSTAARIVVCDERSRASAELLVARTGVELIDAGPMRANGASSAPEVTGDADSPAMYVVTSGSTGRPKIVVQSHRFIVQNTLWAIDQLRMTPEDRYAMLARVGHHAATTSILRPLLSGAALLPVDVRASSGAPLATWIKECRATLMHGTPTVFRHVCMGAHEPGLWASLRAVQLGGEPVRAGDVALCKAYCAPDCRVLIALGSTETGIMAYRWIESASSEQQMDVDTLEAIPYKEVIIVGPSGRPVEAEQTGTILVVGPYIASGYLSEDPGESHGFSIRPDGTRVFHSCDMAMRTHDGRLRLKGRADRQVKIRGNRVHPSEVETALLENPRVFDAAVVARRVESESEPVLVAFVVPDPGAPFCEESLQSDLRRALPSHMWASRIARLDRLPLTASHKVDRRALESMALPLGPGHGALDTSWTDPTHQAIATIWQAAAGVVARDPASNFFADGGDSLGAVAVAAAFDSRFELHVGGEFVFQNPTVELQAARVASAPRHDALNGSAEGHAVPATHAQLGVYCRQWLESRRAPITVSRFLRSAHPLDDALIRQSLMRLVARHEALRTSIVRRKGRLWLEVQSVGEPCQDLVVRRAGTFRLAPDGDGPDAFTYTECPIDPGRPPLVRAVVARCRDGGDILQLTAHHMAGDGNSISVLAREFAQTYAAIAGGYPIDLPVVPGRFIEFARGEHDRVGSEQISRRAKTLSERLANHCARAPDQEAGGSGSGTRTARATTHAPQRSPLFEGVTPFARLLGAWSAALAARAPRETLVIGCPVTSRRATPESPSIGMYVNLVPVFIDIHPERSYGSHVRATVRALREAMERSDLPFEYVLRQSPALPRLRSFPFDALATQMEPEPELPDGFEFVRVPVVAHASLRCPSLVARNTEAGVTLDLEFMADAPNASEVLADLDAATRLLGAQETLMESPLGAVLSRAQ